MKVFVTASSPDERSTSGTTLTPDIALLIRATSSSSSKKSPAQGRAFRSLALVLTVASATARSAATARGGVDVRRAAALRHRGRCCARGGRGRHLRACVHRRAPPPAPRPWLRHLRRGPPP